MGDYVAKPVRLEEVRAIVERWGVVARQLATTKGTATGPQAATTDPAKPDMTAPSKDAPLDMSRLLDFSDGDPANLRELVTLYLTQTREQLDQLDAAVQSGIAAEVRRVAHSCAGASATCGVRGLVALLRELERQGSEGKLISADQLCREAVQEFQRVQRFLEAYLSAPPHPPVKHQP
jgi:HPt (histidine-containing phosphotransfer) domain-containing protein